MDMAKLSIVIPVYNVAQYLDKCVQTVRNQTLLDLEIILIDDESPDCCPQMCDEFARQDNRIKVVHKKNEGLGLARNSGLEVATGEYVTFLDSDDFVDLYTYEHLYTLLKKKNLDVIYYKFKRFTNEEDVIACQASDDMTDYCGEGIKDLMLDIIASEPAAKEDHKIACSSCTAIYRLSIVKDNNVRFHSERELISEDLIFNLDYLKYANKVAFNNGEHYHYRANPTSLTGSLRTDRIEKNIVLYNFIIDNIVKWELDRDKAIERVKRFFIGSSRTAISLCLNSSAKFNKKQWLKEQLNKPIWKYIYVTYDWKDLPIYQRVFFYACVNDFHLFIKLLCKMKSILK